MPEFEQYLHNLFAQRASSKVKDAMMYSLLNQGKRIRPKLLFAVFAVAEQPVMWHLMKQRPFLPVMDY